jgi:hypothetical protein
MLFEETASGQVKVSWTAGSGTPVDYTVTAYSDADRNDAVATQNVGPTQATFGGLEPGGDYYFSVTATNLAGTSEPLQQSITLTGRQPCSEALVSFVKIVRPHPK